MSLPLVRVTVAPGRVVYRGPGAHPFNPGDQLDLPPDHAAELVGAGHVVAADAAPAAEHAPIP